MRSNRVKLEPIIKSWKPIPNGEIITQRFSWKQNPGKVFFVDRHSVRFLGKIPGWCSHVMDFLSRIYRYELNKKITIPRNAVTTLKSFECIYSNS